MTNDIDPALQLTGGNILLGPTFQNAGAINNLTLQGATLTGTNIVTGNLTLAGGYLSGALTINSNATLTLNPGTIYVENAALTNFGTVVSSGSFEFYLENSTPVFFVNNGLWLDLGYTYFENYYSSTATTFINNGVYRKQAPGTYSYFYPVAVNNTGLFDVEAGTLYFEGGGALGGVYNTAAGAFLYLDGGTFAARPAAGLFRRGHSPV